jgi:hypothetical protein
MHGEFNQDLKKSDHSAEFLAPDIHLEKALVTRLFVG